MASEALPRTDEALFGISRVKLAFCKTWLIYEDEREINKIFS